MDNRTGIHNKKWIVYTAGFLCALINITFAVVMIYPGHNWGGDFSQYIAQARALVMHDIPGWYEKNLYIIEHSNKGLGSTVYPWGLPVALYPVYQLFGLNLYAFKALIIMYLSGSIVAVFCLYKRKTSPWYAVMMTLMVAVNPVYLVATDSIQSDIPCLFFTILALLFGDYHLKSEKHHFRNAFLTGLFIFLAVQMRTMSFALLLALLCTDFMIFTGSVLQKKLGGDKPDIHLYQHSKWYYHLVPYFVFIVLDQFTNLILPRAGGTYLDYFSLSYASIKKMMKLYKSGFEIIYGKLFGVFIVLAIIGMVYVFKKEMYLVFYCSGTVVMLLLYDYYQQSRFLYSVFPGILLMSKYGMDCILFHTKKRLADWAYASVIVITIGLYVWQLFTIELPYCNRIKGPIDAYSTDALNTYQYINDHISDDSVIYFFKPRVLYLNTNNYCYTGEDDPDMIEEADYVLFWCNDFQDKIKERVMDNDDYSLIYQNDQFFLYESHKS